MRWLCAVAALLTGCEWFAPETHVCDAGSYCPEGYVCLIDENDAEGLGLCTATDGPTLDDDDTGPFDDDDTLPFDDDDTGPFDDDDAGPSGPGVSLEEPEDGDVIYAALGEYAAVAGLIEFPEDATSPLTIRALIGDDEIWSETDADWRLYDAVTKYFFIGHATDILGEPGPRVVRLEASDAGSPPWTASDEADVTLEVMPTGWFDLDGDGWCPGAPEPFGLGGRDADGDGTCSNDEREVNSDFDCDDTNPAIAPLLDEGCDGLDTDCDGDLGDEEVDADGDGDLACVDCDDADPSRNAAATEVCDGTDNDCDGHADEHEDPSELWEETLDDWQVLNHFTRQSQSDLANCPASGYGLPLCTSGGTTLCPVWATATGAFSSPGDDFDVWRIAWNNTNGVGASGCGTTITVASPAGQPLSAELYIAPTPSALATEWSSPTPLTASEDGVLSITITEGEAELTGANFEDLAFFLKVDPSNTVPQCPTDGYTITVEGS